MPAVVLRGRRRRVLQREKLCLPSLGSTLFSPLRAVPQPVCSTTEWVPERSSRLIVNLDASDANEETADLPSDKKTWDEDEEQNRTGEPVALWRTKDAGHNDSSRWK
ncbi:hypothetical protein NDU88_001172 [Pleurodeles waltl]|uniref:Uncharacterized protein n=1 Tax=Pleurodeles waltl TaxID=8319 RepID=A0AAV7VB16_PLEWA|nr:hypothetical protein NDU88_001172 [Pleurodeles waltl]